MVGVVTAKARVPAASALVAGTSPVLDQKRAQVVARRPEVFRVERSQHCVLGDPVVETVDKCDEPFAPTDPFVHGLA